MTATDLEQLANDELEPVDSVEYCGFHITNIGDGLYQVQLDGYFGTVGTIDTTEFDSALEIVDKLNDYVLLRNEYEYQGDDEAMVEWAGRIMTSDQEKVDEQPDMYVYVPPPGEVEEVGPIEIEG